MLDKNKAYCNFWHTSQKVISQKKLIKADQTSLHLRRLPKSCFLNTFIAEMIALVCLPG